MTGRRFPPPWRADKIAGGNVDRDANVQSLVYVYSRDDDAEALEARRRQRGTPCDQLERPVWNRIRSQHCPDNAAAH
jgi:hypothetical protein